MNPSGLRLEEKKSEEVRSQSSYRSTHSSRSSVLQRAREYNRRVGEQRLQERAQSLERKAEEPETIPTTTFNPKRQTRAKALESVRRDTRLRSIGHGSNNDYHRSNYDMNKAAQAPVSSSQQQAPVRNSYGYEVSKPAQVTVSSSQQQQAPVRNSFGNNDNGPVQGPVNRVSPSANKVQTAANSRLQPQTTRISPSANSVQSPAAYSAAHSPANNSGLPPSPNRMPAEPSPGGRSKESPARSARLSRPSEKEPPKEGEENPIVTPELLVDALAGHEDGLLAIAEKLMEHYDAGYDAMGEAIIDAFADVQKLFQHVVEAAHMEGAAFEASRREAEMNERKNEGGEGIDEAPILDDPPQPVPGPGGSPGGPVRHDEFVDQDVKDILSQAMKKGNSLRENNKHQECFDLLENACQAASALLPVDSDHRGRLQLSVARSESMAPDRACAILRYAMDDVLRSGMRAGKAPITEPSKRADVVLSRPVAHPSLNGGRQTAGVVQSADEALASLMEEMKEIMSAPVYTDTPLQSVSQRFWTALNDAQKTQQKNEERLEQNLGKLKGEFLLARAEWEEKLNQSSELADTWKDRYERLRENRKADNYMDQARAFAKHRVHESAEELDSVKSGGRAASVASFGSGLAQQAKTIVSQMNSFNCNGERSGNFVDDEATEDGYPPPRPPNTVPRTPQRVDV